MSVRFTCPPPLKQRHSQGGEDIGHGRHNRVHEWIRQTRKQEKDHDDNIGQDQDDEPSRPARFPGLIRFDALVALFDGFDFGLEFFKRRHVLCTSADWGVYAGWINYSGLSVPPISTRPFLNHLALISRPGTP